MANNNGGGDDIPDLDDVLSDDDKGGKGNSMDDLLSVDFNSSSPFADDDNGSEIENDPNRAKGKTDEIVFEEDDGGDEGSGELEDFDTKKQAKNAPDRRKMSRLQKETRLKREAREEAAELRRHLDRVTEDTTRAFRMEMTRRKQGAEIFYNNASEAVGRIDRDLVKAKEDGDAEAIGNLIAQRADIVTAAGKAKAIIDDLPDDVIDRFVYDPKLPANLQAVGKTASKGRDWMDANTEWFNDPNRSAEVAATRAMDQALAKEGKLEVGTDEYFIELTRRVARKFPDLDVHTPDGRVARFSGRRRGGSGARDVTGSGAARGASQGQGRTSGEADRITSEEREMLKGFGVDLSNPEHLKAYKENRVNTRR